MQKYEKTGEIRKMESAEEEKGLDKIDKRKEAEMSVMEQSEAAVIAAGEMLAGFESIVEDDTKRMKATTSTGVVLGAGVNFMLDAAAETDDEKRTDLYRKSGVTMMEIATGVVKTLVSGDRRRNSKKV